MLGSAPAEMLIAIPGKVGDSEPNANETAFTSVRTDAGEMMAISRRHAPRQWAYSQDTLAALDDAATAVATNEKGKHYLKGKGKDSTNPYQRAGVTHHRSSREKATLLISICQNQRLSALRLGGSITLPSFS